MESRSESVPRLLFLNKWLPLSSHMSSTYYYSSTGQLCPLAGLCISLSLGLGAKAMVVYILLYPAVILGSPGLLWHVIQVQTDSSRQEKLKEATLVVMVTYHLLYFLGMNHGVILELIFFLDLSFEERLEYVSNPSFLSPLPWWFQEINRKEQNVSKCPCPRHFWSGYLCARLYPMAPCFSRSSCPAPISTAYLSPAQ